MGGVSQLSVIKLEPHYLLRKDFEVGQIMKGQQSVAPRNCEHALPPLPTPHRAVLKRPPAAAQLTHRWTGHHQAAAHLQATLPRRGTPTCRPVLCVLFPQRCPAGSPVRLQLLYRYSRPAGVAAGTRDATPVRPGAGRARRGRRSYWVIRSRLCPPGCWPLGPLPPHRPERSSPSPWRPLNPLQGRRHASAGSPPHRWHTHSTSLHPRKS